MIHVYNHIREIHSGPDNYPVYFGASVISNPYTDLKDKRRSVFYAKSLEEALKRYSSYYDLMYKNNPEFRGLIDEIYEKYKSGIDVYLEDSDYDTECTGEIIKKKLEKRLVLEKIRKLKEEKEYAITRH
jgi:hypothetical protein